jgi:tRNA A-37 threonylcarbamoyl transferase component Bud32
VVSIPRDGQALPHAYTNDVTVLGDFVTKSYRGPEAIRRQQREELAIRSVADRLPVATVVDSRPGVLVLGMVPGRHGQDRIDSGEADAVMFGLGRVLRDVQAIRPLFYGEFHGAGVLVHHDFGPNNVLFAEHDDSIVLIADWEWSTVGSPITDLAWAEFIIRMHHSEHQECLHALFDGYGTRPAWNERQAAMAHRATTLETWVRSHKGAEAASTWDRRRRCIEQWRDIR